MAVVEISEAMRVSSFLWIALASALSLPILTDKADAAAGIFDEIRVGGYDHDASLFGHQKETGVDVAGEILFVSPDLFKAIWSPRPVFGVIANTHGQTSQVYIGLTWTWDFIQNVLRDGDGFYVEGTLGGAAHTGRLDVPGNLPLAEKRKSLGSPVLFREDADIGYRIDQTYSIAISYNHISNADLAKRNEGLNEIGMRVGIRF